MRRLPRALSPSMRRMRFADRSRCCRPRRRPSPSILARRRRLASSVCGSEPRATSRRLRGKAPAVSRARPRPPLAPQGPLPPLRAPPSPLAAALGEAGLPGAAPLRRHPAAALRTSLRSSRRRYDSPAAKRRPACRYGHGEWRERVWWKGERAARSMRTAVGDAAACPLWGRH